MKFHVITLFPEMVKAAAEIGVVGSAIKSGRIELTLTNPREFTKDTHHMVDDRPFGGGDGMVMMAEPLAKSIRQIREKCQGKTKVIHLSPRGSVLNEKKVRELASEENLILISSRYAGIDQRLLSLEVDEEISIGDFILSGGELGALVLIDAIGRQIPGVLGNEASAEKESFSGDGWLEQPQFTRPREWDGQSVPETLMSGDHAKIADYQTMLSLLTTADRRPELLVTLESKMSEKKMAKLVQAAVSLAEKLSAEDAKNLGISNPSSAALILRKFVK
ncbi:MAG: tRNA (guanosine(37)-N1)-methyltransferase TrmD [Bdellovibrionota bacterium]